MSSRIILPASQPSSSDNPENPAQESPPGCNGGNFTGHRRRALRGKGLTLVLSGRRVPPLQAARGSNPGGRLAFRGRTGRRPAPRWLGSLGREPSARLQGEVLSRPARVKNTAEGKEVGTSASCRDVAAGNVRKGYYVSMGIGFAPKRRVAPKVGGRPLNSPRGPR